MQRSGTARTETTLPERTNDFTAGYAAAVVELGEEVQLPVVDLWTSMQAQPDWQNLYLCDGLHFTPAGNQFVYRQLQPVIDKAYPSLRYVLALQQKHVPLGDALCHAPLISTCCQTLLTLRPNLTHTLLQQRRCGVSSIWISIMHWSLKLAVCVCLQDTEDDF